VAKVRSRLLVIDAAVACAAGTVSMHPTSRNCRDFRQTVLVLCHRMALTATIREEWNRHQSGFARTWRQAMMARKKIEPVEVSSEVSLEQRIKRKVSEAAVAAIIEKEHCLIEAAIGTEKRVASLDDQVRRHIRAHRDEFPEICGICWVNPSDPAQEAVAWLKEGAPSDAYWKLGYASTKSDK